MLLLLTERGSTHHIGQFSTSVEIGLAQSMETQFLNSRKLTFIEDYFITKNHHIKFTIGDKSVQNVPARLASSFDIESAYTDSAES